MYETITVDQALKIDNPIWVDVRSPVEFAEGTISQAVNLPLFEDDERAMIGTLYKQAGQEAAKWRALQIVSPKIPILLDKLARIHKQNRQIILFCWRGGMRSKTLATLAALMDIPVCRLEGGYRAYRTFITEAMAGYKPTFKMMVLHGNTGVGKTRLLHLLAKRGMAVLDLEEIAGHRGSAFGAIGQKPKNQKSFDADLFARLESLRIESKAYVWMEAESKRIGRCTLPDFLVEAKENGVHVEVDASIPKRVERIIADYTTHSPSPQTFFDEVEDAVNRIKKKLSQSIRQQVFDALESRDYTSLVELLLVHYYDPQYSHSQQQYQGRFYRVDGEDLEQAAEQCINIQKSLENRTPLQIG